MEQNLFSSASAWIWLEGAADVNCYLQFQTNFTASHDQAPALHISAEGHYAVFLDGNYLPSTQYPDYPTRKSVQCIDLPGCEVGMHRLEIQVWYPGVDTSVIRKEAPGLRFELRQGDRVLAASAADTDARPLAGYRNGRIPNITGQLGMGFSWTEEPEAPWQKAIVVEKPCVWALRPIPELTVRELQPARLHSQGVFTAHESGLQQFANLT